MYTLVKRTPIGELLVFRMPALVTSLVVAEAFYKFHSFVLESVAFLATWYALDLAAAMVERAFVRQR